MRKFISFLKEVLLSLQIYVRFFFFLQTDTSIGNEKCLGSYAIWKVVCSRIPSFFFFKTGAYREKTFFKVLSTLILQWNGACSLHSKEPRPSNSWLYRSVKKRSGLVAIASEITIIWRRKLGKISILILSCK